jgi:hypothetical protein
MQRHNASGVDLVDVVRVGDPPDLPRGTRDPDLLLWAEREDRLLVTRDRNTIPGHLNDHLQSGRHSPGVFSLRRGHSLSELVSNLVLAAYVFDPAEVKDQIRYLP